MVLCLGMQLSLELLLSQKKRYGSFYHLVVVLWLGMHTVAVGCASFGPFVSCSRRVSPGAKDLHRRNSASSAN